jgi:hypothetical protein
MDLNRAANISQIVSIVPGLFCAYAAYAALPTGGAPVVNPSWLGGPFIWGAFGAFVALLVVGFALRVAGSVKASDRVRKSSPAESWLATLATAELRGGDKSIVVTYGDRSVALSADTVDPFVDFDFGLYNGSLWPVTLEQVEGHVMMDGQQLGHNRTVIKGLKTKWQHAQANHVVLRQWLSKEAAAYILARNGRTIKFDLSEVRLTIRLNPDAEHGSPQGGTLSPYMRLLTFEYPSAKEQQK